MEIIIKRKILPDEIKKRIDFLITATKKEIEPKKKLRLKMKLNRLLIAYNEYQEEGELFIDIKEFKNLDREILTKLFTHKRLELIEILSKRDFQSITQLAKATGRDIKNIYYDLKILERIGLVKIIKNGKKRAVELLVDEITVRFR